MTFAELPPDPQFVQAPEPVPEPPIEEQQQYQYEPQQPEQDAYNNYDQNAEAPPGMVNDQFIVSDGAPPIIISQGAPQYIVRDPVTQQPVVLATPPQTTFFWKLPDGTTTTQPPDMTPKPLPPPPQPQQVMVTPQRMLQQGSVTRGSEQAAVVPYTGVGTPQVVEPSPALLTTPFPVNSGHIETVDGFASPYEPQPVALNRNPFFKSYYDVPMELRESERPPPDFVIPEEVEDPSMRRFAQGSVEPTVREPFYEPEYGKPMEFQRLRLRILAQREEDLKDNGPAIQLSDFALYDHEGNRMDLSQCTATVTSGGYSEDFEEFQRLLENIAGAKFLRREFVRFPLDIEINLGQRLVVTAYSWRTASDTPGRDPTSWAFQALIPHGWATFDEVLDFEPPKTRLALCGPFTLNMQEPVLPAVIRNGGGGAMSAPVAPPVAVPMYQQPFMSPVRQQPTMVMQSPARMSGWNPAATQAMLDLLNQPQIGQFPARMEELLKKGADPNGVDAKGRTAFVRAAALPYPSVLQMMLNHGANINSQVPSTGESALHRATMQGDAFRIEMLLQRQADPNLQDAQGDTPLIIAAGCMKPSVVQVLLRYGGRPDVRNVRGQSAIEMLEEECQRQGIASPAADQVRQALLAQ